MARLGGCRLLPVNWLGRAPTGAPPQPPAAGPPAPGAAPPTAAPAVAQTVQEALAALQLQQTLGSLNALWALQAIQALSTQKQILSLGASLLGVPGDPVTAPARCPTCGGGNPARPASAGPVALRRGDGQRGSVTYVWPGQ